MAKEQVIRIGGFYLLILASITRGGEQNISYFSIPLYNMNVISMRLMSRAAERIFIWGTKTKKGTIVSKRALMVHMQIISLMR